MIGRFRHRVLLKAKPETTQGDGGTLVETEVVIGEAWAKLEPVSGREVFEAQRLGYPVTHRIRVRYLPSRMQARTANFAGRTFFIQSTQNVSERGAYIDYLAEERP